MIIKKMTRDLVKPLEQLPSGFDDSDLEKLMADDIMFVSKYDKASKQMTAMKKAKDAFKALIYGGIAR